MAKSETTVTTTEMTLGDVKGMPSGMSKFAGLKILGANVVDVATVTRPVLRQVDNVPNAIRILSHIYKGQEIKRKRSGGTQMAPANLCEVINMETGEEMLFIANKIFQSELDRAYPNQGYVGKYFAVVGVKGAPKSDSSKSLRRYDIMEFKVDKDVGTLTDVAKLPPPVTDNDDDGEDEEIDTKTASEVADTN